MGHELLREEGENGDDKNDVEEPIIVLREGEEILISSEEASLLALGPKFGIMVDLNDEAFEVEVESCIMKYRIHDVEFNNNTVYPFILVLCNYTKV